MPSIPPRRRLVPLTRAAAPQGAAPTLGVHMDGFKQRYVAPSEVDTESVASDRARLASPSSEATVSDDALSLPSSMITHAADDRGAPSLLLDPVPLARQAKPLPRRTPYDDADRASFGSMHTHPALDRGPWTPPPQPQGASQPMKPSALRDEQPRDDFVPSYSSASAGYAPVEPLRPARAPSIGSVPRPPPTLPPLGAAASRDLPLADDRSDDDDDVPMRHPMIIDTDFAMKLLGTDVGFNGIDGTALHNMCGHLEAMVERSRHDDDRAVFGDALHTLAFANKTLGRMKDAQRVSVRNALNCSLVSRNVTEPLAQKIFDHAAMNERTLFNCGTLNQAMMMELVKEPINRGTEQTYAVRVFSTGAAVRNNAARGHARDGRPKVETLYEVTGARMGAGDNRLNQRTVLELIEHTTRAKSMLTQFLGKDDIFDWVDSLGDRNNDVLEHATELEDKNNKGLLKCIRSYLRSVLSPEQFLVCEALLLEGTAAELEHRGSALDATLADRLLERADDARHASLRAVATRAESDSVGRETWFRGPSFRRDVVKDVERAADRTNRPTFAIYQTADDQDRFNLVTARRDRKAEVLNIHLNPKTRSARVEHTKTKVGGLLGVAAEARKKGLRGLGDG